MMDFVLPSALFPNNRVHGEGTIVTFQWRNLEVPPSPSDQGYYHSEKSGGMPHVPLGGCGERSTHPLIHDSRVVMRKTSEKKKKIKQHSSAKSLTGAPEDWQGSQEEHGKVESMSQMTKCHLGC